MRIKFLSVIVSFLFVSFAITSCLDNDNVVEYSSDAVIRAFAIDSAGLKNKYYDFTIDQLKGEIYNLDSLPLGADTIIDRTMISTLSTASGYVVLLNKEGGDSIKEGVLQGLNTVDSFDLRKPIKVKVLATEAINQMYMGVPESQYKQFIRYYTISVRVHQQDPDSLNWSQAKGKQPAPIKKGFSGGKITGRQKAVILNDYIYVYAKEGNEVIAYSTSAGKPGSPANGAVWNEVSVTGLPATTDVTCMLQFKNHLYVVADKQIYYSQDGATWKKHSLLNRNGLETMTLLAAYPTNEGNNLNNTIGISAVVMDGFTPRFAMTDADATRWTLGNEEVPSDFPRTNIFSTVFTNNTGVQGAMLMGRTKTPKEENGEEEDKEEEEVKDPIVPWSSYNGTYWADLSTTSNAFCPILTLPSIIHYGDDFIAFGNEFDSFYKSVAGIAWYKTDKKFYFPKDLTDRAGSNYSMVVDSNNFIWIMCSNSTHGTDDVWRCRLNKLGFEGVITPVK